MQGSNFYIENGWLIGANHEYKSPNFNDRPEKIEIDLLVIHSIGLPPGGPYGTKAIQLFFTNQLNSEQHASYAALKEVRVSSHLLIDRVGEVFQFVSFDQRAWHAGVSSFQGREACNDFSIGIELEGTGDEIPGSPWDIYTDDQYQQLAAVSASLMRTYPAITLDNIKGHCDIAPKRKQDPGPNFDWQRYLLMLEEITQRRTQHLII